MISIKTNTRIPTKKSNKSPELITVQNTTYMFVKVSFFDTTCKCNQNVVSKMKKSTLIK